MHPTTQVTMARQHRAETRRHAALARARQHAVRARGEQHAAALSEGLRPASAAAAAPRVPAVGSS